MDQEKETKKNIMYITRKEFDWGCLYSTKLKSYPSNKAVFFTIRFKKDVEPDRTKPINKIEVKEWFLSAYDNKKTNQSEPLMFINDYENLTVEETPFEEQAIDDNFFEY